MEAVIAYCTTRYVTYGTEMMLMFHHHKASVTCDGGRRGRRNIACLLVRVFSYVWRALFHDRKPNCVNANVTITSLQSNPNRIALPWRLFIFSIFQILTYWLA